MISCERCVVVVVVVAVAVVDAIPARGPSPQSLPYQIGTDDQLK
jgi:hypothetical protein